jgi:hypothetical protein
MRGQVSAFAQAIADYSATITYYHGADGGSLYGRGLAKLKSGDTAGGNADITAAKAIRHDIDKIYADHGVT